jgi:hypothetical protein
MEQVRLRPTFRDRVTDVTGGAMQMSEGQIYRCQNIECGCEVRVVKSSIETSANPRCTCGAHMKKAYTPPILRVLTDMQVLASQRTGHN